jgi:hypothetical protein
MSKKLMAQRKGSPDDFQTPETALILLTPFLNKSWKIWECASGKGNLVNGFKKLGFKVFGTDKGFDFTRNDLKEEYDAIVTNPPYSMKEEFLRRCYELKKPFALLMPLTALESERRQKCYRKYGLQLIIPNKRINFETPSGEGNSSWFATAWFTKGLKLPKDLTFIKVDKFDSVLTSRTLIEINRLYYHE